MSVTRNIVEETREVIAAASREQSAGIEQVNRAVMQMDALTQQNAALVEEATAAAQSVVGQARELSDTLGRYQIAHHVARALRPAAAGLAFGERRADSGAGRVSPAGAVRMTRSA